MTSSTWPFGSSGLRPRLRTPATNGDDQARSTAHAQEASLRFSLPLSDRRLVLVALDLIALNGSLLLALAVRSGGHLRIQSAVHPIVWFIVLSVLWFPMAAAFDVYDPRSIGRFAASGLNVLRASLAASIIYLMIPYVTPSLPGSRLAVAMFPALALAMTLGGRALFSAIIAQAVVPRRTLIVGTGRAGRIAADTVLEGGGDAFQLLGFVRDGGRQRVERLPAPVLGSWKGLPDLVARYQVATLILAVTDEVEGALLQRLTDCLARGLEILPMPVLYEQLTGRVPVQYIGQHWYVAMPLDHPGTRGLYPLLKRCVDVALSLLGLLVLGAILPFVVLAIYLDSPGPVFYAQHRVGKGGRLFKVYKFRSMVPDAEHDGALWAGEHDRRTTRVGRLLRRAHIDEFPQFWNVLRGDMSAVGPRPERPEFVATLSKEMPFYQVRHAVRPGMAGWGLVRQGYGASREDALLKLQYDLYYIKHQSLWLDLVILLKTVLETLTLRGR